MIQKIDKAQIRGIQKASDGIKTPIAQQFSIKPQFISTILSQYANNNRKDTNQYNQLTVDIEDDNQFIEKVLEISEKSQQIAQNEIINDDDNVITDQQCDNIHQLATKHSNANKFNSSSDSTQNIEGKKCPCGCNQAEGDPLPYCKNQTQQYFFGPGIILYFYIIRKLLILVTISAIIYGIFSLTTNILSVDHKQQICKENKGTLSFLCEFKIFSSIKNKLDRGHLIQIQLWLGFIICVIWVVGIRIVRSLGRNLNRTIDSQLDSSSDYCIQISHLPFGQYCEEELLKYICILWRKYKGKQTVPKIKSAQIIYNIQDIRAKINQIIKKANKIVGMVECINNNEITKNKRQKRGSSFLDNLNQAYQITQQNLNIRKSYINQQLSEKNEQNQINPIWKIKPQFKDDYLEQKQKLLDLFKQMQDIRQKFINDPQYRKNRATDMALIEFQDSDQQTQFLKEIRQYRTSVLGDIKDYILQKLFINEEQSNLFKGRPTKITRAPQPSDIHWKNCQKKFSFRRVGLVWLITIGIIMTSFGMLMLIRFLRSNFPELNQMSILVSISLQMFNRIIWNVLCICVQIEENNTKTDNIMSIMSKSMLAQTINITLLPIIMNVVIQQNIFGPQGLIGMTIDYQFMVLLMMFNFNIVNLPYQLKRIIISIPCFRNYVIRKKVRIVGKLDTIEQIADILKFYQGPEFPIAGGYIYMTAVIYHGMFFAHLQPTLIFYLIFNIFCFYWVNKYLLLRRCKIPSLLDFIIFQTSCSLLQHAVLLYGIGSLIFVKILGNGQQFQYYIPSILCIVLWLIHMLNPKKIMHTIVKFFIQKIEGEKSEVKQFNLKEQNDQNQVINNIVKRSFCEKNMTKRRECYYKNSGTNDLLNFEAKLIQIKDTNSVNVNKRFCERFQVNMKHKTPFNEKAFFNIINDTKKNYNLTQNKPIQIKKKTQISIIQIKSSNFKKNTSKQQGIEEEKQ